MSDGSSVECPACGAIIAKTSNVVEMPAEVDVGSQASFRIEARDQMGNLASYPPLATFKYSFAVEVRGPHAEGDTSGAVLPGTPAVVEVGSLSKGRQAASIFFTTVGHYAVSVIGEDKTVCRFAPDP